MTVQSRELKKTKKKNNFKKQFVIDGNQGFPKRYETSVVLKKLQIKGYQTLRMIALARKKSYEPFLLDAGTFNMAGCSSLESPALLLIAVW